MTPELERLLFAAERAQQYFANFPYHGLHDDILIGRLLHDAITAVRQAEAMREQAQDAHALMDRR